MTNIKIPTPLRAFTNNQAQIEVSGNTVGTVLDDLVTQYPELRNHLFNGNELRNFVNVFLGEDDVRFLDGLNTEVTPDDHLRIVPTIAGGQEALRKVDHSGLKTGQAVTIILLILAFVLDSPLLVALVALAQLLGGLDAPFAPYRLLYQNLVKPSGLVKPDVISDNPEPHRFAMLVGALFNSAATLALLAGAPALGWVLVGIVVVLANLNFWVNFCAGCWVYYQLNRLGVPGFNRAPIH